MTTPHEPQQPEGGPLSLPNEWVGMPPRTDSAPSTAIPSAPAYEPAPVPPARSGAQNSRAVIAAILGGVSALGSVMVWTGLGQVILLGVVGAGIAGVVMASMALASVRRGLATNRGLAITGLVLSLLGIAGVVLLYVVVIIALASWV